MSTEQSKILSEFEKYKGYSSNIFNGEDWSEFDAFKAGTEFALTVAAEKAEINFLAMIDASDCVEVDKKSILNCLK